LRAIPHCRIRRPAREGAAIRIAVFTILSVVSIRGLAVIVAIIIAAILAIVSTAIVVLVGPTTFPFDCTGRIPSFAPRRGSIRWIRLK
jgi:hypothetical protein